MEIWCNLLKLTKTEIKEEFNEKCVSMEQLLYLKQIINELIEEKVFDKIVNFNLYYEECEED